MNDVLRNFSRLDGADWGPDEWKKQSRWRVKERAENET